MWPLTLDDTNFSPSSHTALNWTLVKHESVRFPALVND